MCNKVSQYARPIRRVLGDQEFDSDPDSCLFDQKYQEKEVIIIILVPLGFRLCGMIFNAATTATIAQVKIMTQMTSHKNQTCSDIETK